MSKVVYGRSYSMQLKHEREQSDNYVGCPDSLILRTIRDAPPNEHIIRGYK